MKKGAILLNMGGPNNIHEVKVFLENMFDDKNILNIKSDMLRRFVAFIIVSTRINKAKKNYKQIGGLSPLVKHTQKLVDKLNKKNPNITFSFANAYTSPFCKDVLEEFRDFDKLVVVPLYPHYSTTTVKSSLEDFNKNKSILKSTCEIEIKKEFYKNENYNKLILKLIAKALHEDKAEDFDLIFSAHSLPQKIIDKGDIYQEQIISHVEILKDKLLKNGLNFNKIHLAYQSKLGPVKWLKPQLKSKIKTLENKKLIVFPISFTIDNSETDFELSIEYKKLAKKFGFKEYRVCSCPNDDEDFVNIIDEMVKIS